MTFALITGAAKRIGLAVAWHLASKGYNIILHYNTSEIEAQEAVKKIKELGVDVKLCKADLSKPDGIDHLKNFCDGFEITLLINNASVFKNDSILSDDIAQSLNEHLQVNFISKVAIIQSISKSVLLSQKNKLDIITLLDYGILKVPQNFFSYHLMNKFLHSFTQLAAKQLAPKVRVNSIALGQTLKNEGQSQERFNEGISSTPLCISSSLDDLYKTMNFILEVRCMTGQLIVLDGGMHLADNQYK